MSLKFSEMPYSRPDLEQAKKQMSAFARRFRKADSYEAYRAVYFDLQALVREIDTQYMLAYVRNTMNTLDPFYAEEIAFYNESLPVFAAAQKKVIEALLASPFRKNFEKEFGKITTKTYESDLLLQDRKIITQQINEANLSTEYALTAASCKTDFRGETCNFYGLLKHMQSTDREERREAFFAWADLYESVSDKLDKQYTALIRQRDKMAKKLGFSSFTRYAYLGKHRFDYTEEDIATFREQVYLHITPLCEEMYKAQAKRLGIDDLQLYDETLFFPDGNALPLHESGVMVEKANEMYHELSKETGEFFDFMREHELFDLETRPGKHLGGYCTHLPSYGAPFIFSNFNGTSADVDVLTHEAGHAFQHFTAAKTQTIDDNISSTSEVNEIHSMAMEFLTYPYMDKFFGEKADAYRFAHLCSALAVIPYIVCVDEFQHRMYEDTSITPAGRRRIWRELEKKYMPWRKYDGNKFLEKGGYWMQKQHIFLYPFYYIDYALAQLCAFELYGKAKDDPQGAWEQYMRLCRAGGSLGYFDLLKEAGLHNPLKGNNVQKMIASVKKEIRQGIKAYQ